MLQKSTLVLDMARRFFTHEEHVVTFFSVASGMMHLENMPACDVTVAVERPCPECKGL